MRKKTLILSFVTTGVMFLLTIALLVFYSGLKEVLTLPRDTYVSLSDIDYINENNVFGDFIDTSMEKDEIKTSDGKYVSGKVVFKLFGILPVKTVNAKIISNDNIYLGGNPLGFSIKIKGVLVIGQNSVQTSGGAVDVIKNDEIKIGDIITHIDNKELNDVADIAKCLNIDSAGKEVAVKGIRKGKQFEVKLKPALDLQSNRYKLGIWIRDDASGIGTLTYAKPSTMEFGALGHYLSDSETGSRVEAQSGKMYACTIVGLEKGQRGNPGQIKGVFLESKKNKGIINGSGDFGIFGEVVDKAGIIDENVIAEVGGRLAVKPGKAKLVSSVSGAREEYDIEIVKANKQDKANDKSMVIRVTDKRLLNLTGGIVQGMSGSPIKQDGKLVGALTHVFVSDPTKGYAIYIDWMLA